MRQRMEAPDRIRAIRQDRLGGPEVLRVVEMERPRPGPGEILARVVAAGVNPSDWKTRETGAFLGRPPFVLGRDVSGVVAEAGPGVTLFRPGDAVFGMPRFPHESGAYAEYLTGPARHFAHKPDGVDHTHAAALPLAALTAWQALVDTADLRAGQRVLIHAAAGGVGHLAVQIAKARGAHVIATARKGKHGFLRGLGADETVDYTREDVTRAARDLDVVLDAHGGYGEASLRALVPGGVLVSIVDPAVAGYGAYQHADQAKRLGVRAALLLVEPDHAGMKAIADLAASGRLRAELDTVLPLEEVATAHKLSASDRTTGKIVLTIAT